MLILPSAAGAIVKEHKLLIVHNKVIGKWQVPGGLCEPNEAIKDTVQRELKEELGLELQATDLISVYSEPTWINEYPNGDKVKQLIFFFKMEGDVGEIVLQKNELSEFKFITQEEIPDNTVACCKQKIKDFFAFRGHTVFR